MKRVQIVLVAGLLLAAIPQFAQSANTPRPGTINYIEGQVSLGGQLLPDNAGGIARLDSGQVLATQNGRAELLLTPGIFLRIGDRSTIEMVSSGLANTIVTLRQGRAFVDVAAILPENNVVVNETGVSTRLMKPGLYEFDAGAAVVRVFEGKARVLQNGSMREISSSHEFKMNSAHPRKFDKAAYQDDFYRWASLRASYVADANVDAAGRYVQQPDLSNAWGGTGWYWDPWYDSFTFIPGDGIFYSPFGFGFYSPRCVWGAPHFGHWGGGHHFGSGYRPYYTAGSHGFRTHAGPLRGSGMASGGFGPAARGCDAHGHIWFPRQQWGFP